MSTLIGRSMNRMTESMKVKSSQIKVKSRKNDPSGGYCQTFQETGGYSFKEYLTNSSATNPCTQIPIWRTYVPAIKVRKYSNNSPAYSWYIYGFFY